MLWQPEDRIHSKSRSAPLPRSGVGYKVCGFMIIVNGSAASDGREPADDDVLFEMMKFHALLMTAGVVRWVEAFEPSSRGVRVQYTAG